MALSGILTNAQVVLTTSGTSMGFSVLISDDALGPIGTQSYQVSDPATVAQVEAYIASMLPGVAQQVGIPIVLPVVPAPTPPPEPTPEPEPEPEPEPSPEGGN